VPAIAWKSCPGGPFTVPIGCGVMPAITWMPGAVMSGLMKSPTGPRDENVAITLPFEGVSMPVVHVAVTPGFVEMNVVRSVFGPSTWIVGSQWLSVSTSCAIGL
jgi:hypothetical protein